MRCYQHLKPFLIVALLTVAIYSNSLTNGFVYDDRITIVDNTLIRDATNLPKLFQESYFALSGEESYRPVVTFTYFVDYAIYGLKPWGYHLTNIALHITNSLLLYVFITLLTPPSSISLKSSFINMPLLSTLLFVTHPVLTETVNAISYREDLLAFLFYITTLLLYLSLRSRPTGSSRSSVALIYILSCITYSLSLFSKEMAVTLPVIIACYDWVYRKREGNIRFNSYNAGYIIITIGYLYLQFYFLDRTGHAFKENIPTWSLPVRLLTVPWLLMTYVKLSSFPVLLSVGYTVVPIRSIFQMSFAVPLAVAASLLGIVVITRKKEKHIAFGILFFVLSLLPVYNIVRITNPLAERYLYLPFAGIAVAMGFFVHHLTKVRTTIALILFSITVCLYAITAIERNRVWESDYSLWTDVLKKQSNSARAHYNMGNIYLLQGDIDEAMQHFQAAVKLNKYHSEAHNNLGVIYRRKMRLEEAVQEFQAAIGWHPDEARYYNNLGLTYVRLGRFNEAVLEFQNALRLKVDYEAARYNLSQAYLAMGRGGKAREELRERN